MNDNNTRTEIIKAVITSKKIVELLERLERKRLLNAKK